MTPDEPTRGGGLSRSEEQQHVAERRLLDEMARHRRAQEAELRRFRHGCIGLIVAFLLALVVGFMFF